MMNKIHTYGPLKLRWEPRQAHHMYWGAILVILGIVSPICMDIPPICVVLLCVIGVALVLDDIYQHWRQVKEPEYHSPVHRLYVKYLRGGLIIKLEKWIDGLGK